MNLIGSVCVLRILTIARANNYKLVRDTQQKSDSRFLNLIHILLAVTAEEYWEGTTLGFPPANLLCWLRSFIFFAIP